MSNTNEAKTAERDEAARKVGGERNDPLPAKEDAPKTDAPEEGEGEEDGEEGEEE